ncbi:hypothetical protein [Bacillus subtilis]|uniref:hypothetical protein n=1 Tax=Bacillus subtilis TaxID=1423 RepID=UPI00145A4533|nr:hypothetical protein [Bacillus subtilis]QNK37963.1 hypothetical protein H8S71_06360 [Bacillus subtilis subsp. subtilis]
MAVLDESLKIIMGDKQYYSILARATLKELKDHRWFDYKGKEKNIQKNIFLNK